MSGNEKKEKDKGWMSRVHMPAFRHGSGKDKDEKKKDKYGGRSGSISKKKSTSSSTSTSGSTSSRDDDYPAHMRPTPFTATTSLTIPATKVCSLCQESLQ